MKRDSLLKIRAEFNGSVENSSNSITDELEIPLSCNEPLKRHFILMA